MITIEQHPVLVKMVNLNNKKLHQLIAPKLLEVPLKYFRRPNL